VSGVETEWVERSDRSIAEAVATLDAEASELRARLAAVDAARRRLLPLLSNGSATLGRGQALAAEAVLVLQAAGEGLHYREIAQRIRARGTAIQGVDPEATLLTSISRDPRIGRIGRGIYGLTEATVRSS
jgi:HB1/ASXL restriction endonuclease-like protein with HTH domain